MNSMINRVIDNAVEQIEDELVSFEVELIEDVEVEIISQSSKTEMTEVDFVNNVINSMKDFNKSKLIRALSSEGWPTKKIARVLMEMGIVRQYQHVRNVLHTIVKKSD